MREKKVLLFAREMRKNQTKAEKQFWKLVRRRQVLGIRFNRQFIIKHSEILGKEEFYIVDFYNYEKKIVVEIDGEIHKYQLEYDKLREDTLIDLGYHIIRFKNEEVLNDIESVISKLEVFIRTI